MGMFSFKRFNIGDAFCYAVLDADQKVIGRVRKRATPRSWQVEEAESTITKDFSTRDDAALWLVGRHTLHMPSADRVLAFDPTPAGLIGKKLLRKDFKHLWAQLRRERFKNGDISCDICRTMETKKELIDAHEVYSFPTPKMIHLDKILFVCKPCHYAIHFDRTRSKCSAGYINEIQKHYMKVNGGLSQEEFDCDFDHSRGHSFGLRQFYKETYGSTQLDFGPYQSRVNTLLEKRRVRSERLADDNDDDDFEFLPDHEYPMDTAMWRDTFSSNV